MPPYIEVPALALGLHLLFVMLPGAIIGAFFGWWMQRGNE